MSRSPRLDAYVQETAQELLDCIKKTPGEPVAIEVMWDGDFNLGWLLDLCVVVRPRRGTDAPGYESIGLITFPSRAREGLAELFDDVVPERPDCEVARQAGRAAAAILGVPFWFPSPENVTDDVPHWWERDQATPCEDCAGPMLLREGLHEHKTVCSHCLERRERLERLRTDDPRNTSSDGFLCVTHLGNTQVGGLFVIHWSEAGTLIELTSRLGRPIHRLQDVTLGPGELRDFNGLLTQYLEARLKSHIPPDPHFRGTTWTIPILGGHIVLNALDNGHRHLDLMNDFLRNLAGCKGDEVLSFFSNAEISSRGYLLACFLRRQGERRVDLTILSSHLQELGGPEDIQEIVRELEARGCVSTRGGLVRLTLKGQLLRAVVKRWS